MCGIAGVAWTNEAEPIDESVVRRMIRVLAHRGPDDEGLVTLIGPYDSHPDRRGHADPHTGPGAILGHRRLAIIDLAGGHQPLANEDGSIHVVFNGEIYNYRELRRQLQSAGHRFRTESDTETIVHLYEEHGVRCVEHLRGMFALAVWDDRKKRLLLARDRLGQKPLVYRLENGHLFFASELKALLQVPGAPRELDPTAVDLYLAYQYVPHPWAIFKGYNKLPPAHIAVFEDGSLDVRRYWSPPFGDETMGDDHLPDGIDHAEWSRRLRDVLTESVRLRLRSDVPLGAFLSGGVDSTIIVGLMQRLADEPVHTFSIGFPVRSFDERHYAREAAEFLGTRHREFVVDPQARAILPRLVWHYDEPFADSSAIPTMYLSEMTRQDVKVALSGDGGDELFAGYERYRAVRLAQRFDRLPTPVRGLLTSRFWQKLPASVEQKTLRRRLKRFLAALSDDPQTRYRRWIGIFDDPLRAELYSDQFREQVGPSRAGRFMQSAYEQCAGPDFVTQTTCVDVLTYLPCDLLTKVDIASMSYGLECRSPFMDHRLVELAARMPLELKLTRQRGKRILLDTFGELLPPSIRRRKKMGFGVPIDHWFRGELRSFLQETLLDTGSINRGLFRRSVIERLIDEHVGGRADHAYRLWALLIFELWQRTWLDPAVVPTAPASTA